MGKPPSIEKLKILEKLGMGDLENERYTQELTAAINDPDWDGDYERFDKEYVTRYGDTAGNYWKPRRRRSKGRPE